MIYFENVILILILIFRSR